ncbi:flagellar hook-associated protein FlgK [Microbacterium sp. STN6]|uniref:flagellar hook-associated protein FlgK n=1 Tax=Microbacterium sp. STN6 TaxID=2995588 RepID=UPI002260BECF|nr:flagellar hook-associated protein FlgK [Microbacterium sp. STN6]MCX7522369.1 flagellar hook-associated protein FlgK [Microbacterium sp. STN6]
MSTFSGLNTAYTGLVAARQGLDVVGQNIANASTTGYTRQRVNTSAIGPVASTGLFSAGVTPGQGVSVDSITRLADGFLDARVRTAASADGYWSARSSGMTTLETSLNEPGSNGISTQLQNFWSAWSDLSNNTSLPASGGVVLQQASVLTAQIAQGYTAVTNQWSQTRTTVSSLADSVNQAAAQIADLNGRIRSTTAAGGSVNELLDQRSLLTTSLANLVGGTVRDVGDGTVDVLVGGNALVSGDRARSITAVGSQELAGAATDPVHLEWADRPGTAIELSGGTIAGSISLLAPASGGSGGALAEAAESYNTLAKTIADQVNAVHSTGVTSTGTAGGDFFSYDPANAALSLSVVPTSADQIAIANPTAGNLDGSIADAISQLGVAKDSPDHLWSTIVTGIGVASKTDGQQASLSGLASTNASSMQLSNASVDMDEENMNMLMFQHAYQGAARVMTAVDELLDTLINKTGLVGR